MAKRSVILGKVMRAPEYDDFRPPVEAMRDIGLPASPTFKGMLFLEKDINGERDRAKALLIRLGVDGDVPLAQARINAGLDEPYPDPNGGTWIPRWMHKHIRSAIGWNDNDTRRAEAA